jgi:hypothetical protein
MSEKTKFHGRHAARPDELEAYEPPQVIVLGCLPELTGGFGGATPEPLGTSAD